MQSKFIASSNSILNASISPQAAECLLVFLWEEFSCSQLSIHNNQLDELLYRCLVPYYPPFKYTNSSYLVFFAQVQIVSFHGFQNDLEGGKQVGKDDYAIIISVWFWKSGGVDKFHLFEDCWFATLAGTWFAPMLRNQSRKLNLPNHILPNNRSLTSFAIFFSSCRICLSMDFDFCAPASPPAPPIHIVRNLATIDLRWGSSSEWTEDDSFWWRREIVLRDMVVPS